MFLFQHDFDILTITKVWLQGKGALQVHLALNITCADPIFQGVSAVNQDLAPGTRWSESSKLKPSMPSPAAGGGGSPALYGAIRMSSRTWKEEYVHHLQQELHSLLLPALNEADLRGKVMCGYHLSPIWIPQLRNPMVSFGVGPISPRIHMCIICCPICRKMYIIIYTEVLLRLLGVHRLSDKVKMLISRKALRSREQPTTAQCRCYSSGHLSGM